MAEPGKETVAPPPPPQETDAMDAGPAATATADPEPPLGALAAEAEPVKEATTPPPEPVKETEPTDAVARALNAALPTAESDRRPPLQEKPDAAAASQPPQQTTAEAEGLLPAPTKAEEVAALLPPPSETPSQEMPAAEVEAEKQPPVPAAAALPQQPPPQQTKAEAGGLLPAPTKEEEGVALLPPPPETPSQERAAAAVETEKQPPFPAAAALPQQQLPPPPQQQQQEGRASEEASSVHEDKDATLAARRLWRHLQAAVRLIFLRCKRAQRGEKPAPDGEKPTLADGGEMELSAPDRKQPASGQQEQVATSPPPAETPSQERTTAAAEAEKPLAAPPQPPPPQKQEGVALQLASSVQEEGEDAAPARAQEREETPARRRWRWLRNAVRLLFLRYEEGEAKPSAPGAKQPVSEPEDEEGEAKTSVSGPEDEEDEAKPSAPGGKQPVSGVEDKKTTSSEKKSQRKGSAGGAPAEPQPQAKKWDKGDMKPSAPDGKHPASGQQEQKPKKESTAGVLDKPEVKQKDEGKGNKGRHDENETQAAPSAAGDDEPAAGAAPIEEGKGDGIKPVTSPDGDKGHVTKPAPEEGKQPASGPEEEGKQATPKKQHPKWPREEARLEEILEDAFTRLLAADYHELSSVRQKCLLTFSVFELASEVKKQAMVYWWVAEFNLRHRSDQSDKPVKQEAPTTEPRNKRRTLWRARRTTAAPAGGGNQLPALQGKAEDGGKPDGDAEGILSELSSHGFLEPIKNWCSKVIHGCKVNPLVHWMVKRRARDDRFADLDVKGNPAVLQPNSRILCLTAGNRAVLQKIRMEDESQQVENKSKSTRRTSLPLQNPIEDKAADQGSKNIQPLLHHDRAEIEQLFEGKQVILNINAHVYPVSKSIFLHLADCLVVLQLGRWCNLDDNTYMEVDGLESLSEIGLLKNLRYLSLRGLSRLTELPQGIQWLKKLAILDMRGCQNLVNVASKITKPLKHLTHLDLTECYMLEHIDKEITSLSELQVFKGFVFATGTQGNKACRLQDLRRLKKLEKLTINITTDANVGKGEMKELKNLASLRKLTITWSEIPSILDGDSEVVRRRREDLIEKWTSFGLPQELLKLDIRCYPKKELNLKVHNTLKKLYLRGGDLERFSIDKSIPDNSLEKTNSIKTLRLKYLKNFSMQWKDICSLLTDVEYVEIVHGKNENLMKDVDKDQKNQNMDMKDQKDKNIDMKDQNDKNMHIKVQKDNNIGADDKKDKEEERKLVKTVDIKDQKDKNTDVKDQSQIEEDHKLVKHKKIVYSNLDENGVWVKDTKEEENLRYTAQATKEPTLTSNEANMEKEALAAMEKSKGSIEEPSTQATSAVTNGNKNDNHSAVKEESEDKRRTGGNP